MFVHKDFQHQGIVKQLMQMIENRANQQNNKQIFSDVSVTARPFFESQGFIVEEEKMKKGRYEDLLNYKMIKMLNR